MFTAFSNSSFKNTKIDSKIGSDPFKTLRDSLLSSIIKTRYCCKVKFNPFLEAVS